MTVEGDAMIDCPVVISVERWPDFAERINEQIGELFSHRFVFRGQRSSRFALASSFDRRYGSLSFDRRRVIEGNLLDLYREAVVRHGLSDGDDVTYPLGQHFGLPSRLLDWSESRYIAVFFAFAGLEDQFLSHADASEAGPGENVSVFALDTASPVIDDERLKLIAPKYSAANPRLTAQLGLFIQNKTQKNTIEEYISEYMAESPDAVRVAPLYRFDIPIREARGALRDLAEMGISYSRLFPGLEGAAKEAKLDDWLGTPPPRPRS